MAVVELFQRIVEEAPVALVVLDQRRRIRIANREADRLLGTPLAGQEFDALFAGDDRHRVRAYAAALVSSTPSSSVYLAAQLWNPDGPQRFVEAMGRRLGVDDDGPVVVVALTDVTSHRAREQALARRSLTDALTGLPNRALLEDRLRQATRAGQPPGSLAVVDLDHFKTVNDRYGHEGGDRVMRLVATRLTAAVPDGATVARHGGDEFVVLLPGVEVDQARAIVTRALESVTDPMTLGGQVVVLTASAGLAPLDAGPPDVVLRQADAAMYEAKKSRSNRVVVYGPEVAAWAENLWDLAATVAQLEQDRDRLRVESRTDPLTGLPNLRAMEETVPVVAAESRAAGQPFSVLFIDIDRFGAFNKRRGDDRGDVALREVARVVAENCREGDTAYRKGGEEMVLLLPRTAHADALAVGERIRAAVEALRIAHEGWPDTPVLTITVGVATAGDDEPADAVIKAASDAALHSKNAEHRNRTVSATERS